MDTKKNTKDDTFFKIEATKCKRSFTAGEFRIYGSKKQSIILEISHDSNSHQKSIDSPKEDISSSFSDVRYYFNLCRYLSLSNNSFFSLCCYTTDILKTCSNLSLQCL